MILYFRQDTADRSISPNMKTNITKKLLGGSRKEVYWSSYFSPEFKKVFVNYYDSGGERQKWEESGNTAGNGRLVCGFP